MMMEGRKDVSDKVPDTEEEEEQEVVATVQQAVSYFTSNNNKVISPVDIIQQNTSDDIY